ncbi:MAG: YbeD family protein [Thiogranum sp.]
MRERDTLLEFPCDFPVKAMGRSDSGFEAKALAIVRNHLPDFDPAGMRRVASRKGGYISVTFDLRVTSQEQLDELYRELSACEELLVVL